MIKTKPTIKAERDLRYIYAKLPGATDVQLGLLAAFIRGLNITGFDYHEFDRELPDKCNRTRDRLVER